MELAGKKINFLGDSITQGVGSSAPEHIYLNVLKRNAHLAEARNYGVSGTRIARQSTFRSDDPSQNVPFDRDFILRMDEMDRDADIVVVFGGTNDYGHGDAPIGTFSDRTPNTFYGACHVLMRGLIERFPDATIVFMTPMHRREEVKSDAPDGSLENYVRILQEVASYYALPVLDLFRTVGIQPAVPILQEKFLPDGLHPNDAGNAKIAARLQAFLESL